MRTACLARCSWSSLVRLDVERVARAEAPPPGACRGCRGSGAGVERPPNQGGRRSATSVGATTAPQLGQDITKFEALTRLYGIECTYIRGTVRLYHGIHAQRVSRVVHAACTSAWITVHACSVRAAAQSSGLSPAHQLFISSIHVRTPISAPAGEESPRRECARTVYKRQIPARLRRASGSPLEDRAG